MRQLRFSSAAHTGQAQGLLALDDDTTAWRPAASDDAPWLELLLGEPTLVDGVVLKEQIRTGQRIEGVRVLGEIDDRWELLARCPSVGYQRILRFAPARLTALRVEIRGSRGVPRLSGAAVLRAAVDGEVR